MLDPSPNLIFVGLPGAGKTTVGRHLATILERKFTDFDEIIASEFGKSVSKIFEEYGESTFRSAEVALSQTMAATPGHILSPGGGWIANEPAVAHLRPVSRIIYLRVSPDEALIRLGPAVAARPLLATGDTIETLRALERSRRPLYEAAADLTIDTARLDPEALLTTVVAQIIAAWNLNTYS